MNLFDFPVLLLDIRFSLVRVFIAALLAWILAVVSGWVLVKSRWCYHLLLPVINWNRQLSPFVWLPFAIMIFGLGELPILAVLFIAMYFPATLMVYEIFGSFPRELYDEAICSGAHGIGLLMRIELPVVLAQLINVWRIMWAVGWSTVIAAEMLGVSSGLGFRLLDFRYLLAYPQMLFYMLVIGLIGVVSDLAFKKLQTRYSLR
jgi:NitT/TauT family transport system permease protein